MVENKYNSKMIEPRDFVAEIIGMYGTKTENQYSVMHRKMMVDFVKRRGHLDILDWLTLGMHYSKAGEEEIAYQCFYMAHLQDHQRFMTNSGLQFETSGAGLVAGAGPPS